MVKDIKIKLIKKSIADKIVKKYHYSGKVTQNSQLNYGVFYNDELLGAAQFGPSIDKRRMGQNLGIGMNESLELNRLAISDKLGKNAESRVLGICLRMIKKQYPFIRCIISFADACQCGDGTIYRASNFKLHSFKKNNSLLELNDEALRIVKKYMPTVSKIMSKKALDNTRDEATGKYLPSVISDKTLNDIKNEKGQSITSSCKKAGARPLVGYQMKYIYFFDKELEKRFKFVDFKDIPEEVKMYKGIKKSGA